MKSQPTFNRFALQHHRSSSSFKSASPSSLASETSTCCWTATTSNMGFRDNSLLRATALRSNMDLSLYHGSRVTLSSSKTTSINEGRSALHHEIVRPTFNCSSSEQQQTNESNKNYGWTVEKPDLLICLFLAGVTSYIDATLQGWVRWLDKLPLFLLILPSSLWWPNSSSTFFMGGMVLGNRSSASAHQRVELAAPSNDLTGNAVLHETGEDGIDDDNEEEINDIFSPAKVNAADDSDLCDPGHEWGHFAYFRDDVSECQDSFLPATGAWKGLSLQVLVPLHETDEEED